MSGPASFQVPPALLACALAFWGWQTKNSYAAAGFALALLLPVLTKLRLDLAEHDQHRIADLTLVLYVAVAASLVATDGLRTGVHDSLVWLPGVALPLMLAQVMGVKGRLPLTALFRYLRRLKSRGEKIRDAEVDLTGPYLALILISAGMANPSGHGFFIGLVLIVALALARIRPSRVKVTAWLFALAVSTGAGFAAHSGLYSLQTLIEDWIIDLQLRGPLLDPYRSSTSLGELGRLKTEDAIIMRVYAAREGTGKPALLHRASYNHYAGTTWLARHGHLEAMAARGDGTFYPLGGRGAPDQTDGLQTLRVSQRVQGGRALLALPLNSSEVGDLVASRVRSNQLGAIQAEMEVPWTFFNALFSTAPAIAPAGYAQAGPEDLHVPSKERPALQTVASQLGLEGMSAAAAIRRVEAHFAGFEYATARNHPFSDLVSGSETALAEFLTTSHRGHCEYFATATTLLLRTAGIPARYATGYAVQDWSAWEEAWVVRERHSHAWARAFVDGQWTDVDTTPAAWFTQEESLTPAIQRVVDLLRWAGFRWSTRDGSETRLLAWGVVALAALILVWKLVTEGGLVRLAQGLGTSKLNRPGSNSEFYAIEALLAKTAPRRQAEPMLEWLAKAASALQSDTRIELERLARLHYRYRFDPRGLDEAERISFSTGCHQILASMRRVK